MNEVKRGFKLFVSFQFNKLTIPKVKIIFGLILASFFYACKSDDVPNNLIPEDVMVDLLCETHILESKVGRLSLNSFDSASVAFHYLQKELWDKYNVDSITYNQSYEYYSKYPKLFSAIYDKIEIKLDAQETEAMGYAEPIP